DEIGTRGDRCGVYVCAALAGSTHGHLADRLMRTLRDIAHTRAGDKGDTSNISVIGYDKRDYELLEREVTAARVKEHLGDIVRGDVVRYTLPQLGALNFVLEKSLAGGVT